MSRGPAEDQLNGYKKCLKVCAHSIFFCHQLLINSIVAFIFIVIYASHNKFECKSLTFLYICYIVYIYKCFKSVFVFFVPYDINFVIISVVYKLSSKKKKKNKKQQNSNNRPITINILCAQRVNKRIKYRLQKQQQK